MFQKLILLVSLSVFSTYSCGQELISVKWQQNLTSNSHINKIYDQDTDSHGNVITLASFPVEANIPGQTLHDEAGEYFICKQDTSGNIIYAVNFGGQSYLAHGELEVSDDDDITIALNYKGDFYWNDTILASSPNFTAVIMKLNSALTLLWYVQAPCVKQTYAQLYTEDMVQDENESIYTCIRFIDSIEISGTVFANNGTSYGLVLTKFDSLGNHNWTHQFQSQPGSLLQDIVLAYNNNSTGVSEIIISGYHPADILYIDSIPIFLDSVSGIFITRLDVNGNTIQSERIRNLDQIIDFDFYEERIFFAGMFHDTVNWTGGSSYSANSSMYIGELSDTLEIVNFYDLITNSSIHLKGFGMSEKYGFVLHGNYHQEPFTTQSTLINVVSSPKNGAFLLMFDQTLTLNQAKYVPAEYFDFQKVTVQDSLLYAGGIFANNLYFANDNNNSWNQDVIVLRVGELNQLTTFENLSIKEEINEGEIFRLYPNPANDILKISGVSSSSMQEVSIYNLSGLLIKKAIINQNSVSISDLPAGLYLFKFDGLITEPLRFIKE